MGDKRQHLLILLGQGRDTVSGEMAAAGVASTDVTAQTTAEMLWEMPWAWKVTHMFDFCVLLSQCHSRVFLVPVSLLPFSPTQQQWEH